MKSNILFLIGILVLASCSNPKARRPITSKTHVSLASTAKDLKKINAIEDEKILKYIQLDSTKTYINSQSGFWYTVLNKSNKTRFPKFGDEVAYTLKISDLSNQVIYAASELGDQAYLVDKQELITGLQLGIKLMNEGDEIQFLIPAYNAYGIIGDEKKIGTNQSIIATVKLNTIK